MPFRQKLKKAFGRSPSTSTSSTTPSTSTSTSPPPRSSKKASKQSKPSKPSPSPSEPVPKYRGPVNPAHQATLSAFTFGSAAWAGRRRSGQSQYSPMGSRMPSRVGSVASLFGREGGAGGRKSRRQSRVEGVREVEGDADVGNVGLSRPHTASTTDTDGPLSTAGTNRAMPGLEAARAGPNGHADPLSGSGGAGKPFSEDELALALTRSTLRA